MARAKAMSLVLPGIASVAAVLVTLLKPTGADVKDTAKAYELLRNAVEVQRVESQEMRRELEELRAWLKVWTQYQDERRHVTSRLTLTSRGPASVGAGKRVTSPDRDGDGIDDASDDVPELPPIPVAKPPSAGGIQPLPTGHDVFKQ